jgi:hypothetical protein
MAMAALDTVQKFVTRARALMQDATEPYRYSDEDLVEAMNLGVLEMRRLRMDIFLSEIRTGTGLPEYSSSSLSDSVTIDEQYRMALLYYICGHTQMRDEEDTQDSRAAVFLNKFTAQMLTIQA